MSRNSAGVLADLRPLLLPGILLIGGFFSWYQASPLVGVSFISLTWIYLAFLLYVFASARVGDKLRLLLVPKRAAAIPLLALTWIALVFSGAACYQGCNTMNFPERSVSTCSLGNWEAVYFSIVTTATVGFGDISPAVASTRIAVSLQILTSLLLFLVALPIAVSRFSEPPTDGESSPCKEKHPSCARGN